MYCIEHFMKSCSDPRQNKTHTKQQTNKQPKTKQNKKDQLVIFQ